MIRSMTGYGRAESTGTRTILTVECKSVNHRHLDVSLKLPRVLTSFEADARRMIQAAVQRGRVDVSAAVTAAEGTGLNPLSVNIAQGRGYAEAARRPADALGLSDSPSRGWVTGQPVAVTREEPPPPRGHGGRGVRRPDRRQRGAGAAGGPPRAARGAPGRRRAGGTDARLPDPGDQPGGEHGRL